MITSTNHALLPSDEFDLIYARVPRLKRGFGWSISLIFLCEPKSMAMVVNEEALQVKIFQKIPTNMIPEQKIFLQQYQSK
ncbi:MAG: hypothetical protein HY939_06300 [Gammaproteobacteria bacterium]|nr:hypothetical protein [Gammaproteobacteria bacterium]